MSIDKKYAKTQRGERFLESEEGKAAYAELCRLVEDDNYTTTATFSPTAENGSLLFIDKHMTYLCGHLSVNTEQYLSNLRLITKVRK